jgi:hemoglobin
MTQLTKQHIEKLVMHFYQKVQTDDMLGPIFNDTANVDWAHHIPLICQFWNSIMLKTNEYHGNAYTKHVMLGRETEITEQHFSRWLMLFQDEAQKHLPEAAALNIIDKATLIANSLKIGAIKNG